MDSLEISQITENIYNNFCLNNYEEVKMQLLQLENSIMAKCLETSSMQLDESFYQNLILIIEEIDYRAMSSRCDVFGTAELEIAKKIFTCLRNSFYKNTNNQNMVGEKAHFVSIGVNFLSHLAKMDLKMRVHGSIKENVKPLFFDTMTACITYFVNLIAGNSPLRNGIAKTLQLILMDIVVVSGPEVNHVGAALLHQFLLEDDAKQNISFEMAIKLVPSLLNAYIHDGRYACFALYCLEIFIESEGVITSAWKSLKPVQSLLLLDILASNIQKEKVPIQVLSFFKEFMKEEADKIFRTFRDVSTTTDPQIVIRVASFICNAASSDHYRNFLQKDKSLLISSVYLLRGITKIGDNFQNNFTRVSDASATEEIKSHPAFGFKCDLIRLIAALVYCNKINQDQVREINGILLILENSQYDARNPLIKEACIVAIRNLVEGNEYNQKVIANLQLKGPAENDTLSRLGLEVSVQNGKVSLFQKNPYL